MSYKFSKTSEEKIKTCKLPLRLIANEVIKHYDCTVICGYRSEEEQNLAFNKGNSKVKFPDSTHNELPSDGLDLAPYIKGKGISWNKIQCYHFAGYFKAVADMMGISIRCGADWDNDTDVNDQNFNDLCHFELI